MSNCYGSVVIKIMKYVYEFRREFNSRMNVVRVSLPFYEMFENRFSFITSLTVNLKSNASNAFLSTLRVCVYSSIRRLELWIRNKKNKLKVNTPSEFGVFMRKWGKNVKIFSSNVYKGRNKNRIIRDDLITTDSTDFSTKVNVTLYA